MEPPIQGGGTLNSETCSAISNILSEKPSIHPPRAMYLPPMSRLFTPQGSPVGGTLNSEACSAISNILSEKVGWNPEGSFTSCGVLSNCNLKYPLQLSLKTDADHAIAVLTLNSQACSAISNILSEKVGWNAEATSTSAPHVSAVFTCV